MMKKKPAESKSNSSGILVRGGAQYVTAEVRVALRRVELNMLQQR
jgi:hypothetical protein